MKILLCSKSNGILNHWKDNVKDFDLVNIKDEDALINILYTCNDSLTVFLETKWCQNDIKSIIEGIKGWCDKANILVLSQTPNFLEGKSLLEYGINGYGNTYMQDVHMLDALHTINKGDIWLYPEFIQQMIKNISQPTKSLHVNESALETLSAREKEITMMIYEGHSNKDIAQMSGITVRTVKAHTSSIYQKLSVKDRVSLVLLLKSI